MDKTNSGQPTDMVRQHLKVLLLHLAAKSENPSRELQALLQDVLNELHAEVKEKLRKNPQLKLVVDPGPPISE